MGCRFDKFKNWVLDPIFSKKKWFAFISFSIVLGVILALILGGLVFGFRHKHDEVITYQMALNSVIMPCLMTGVTITILLIMKIRFKQCLPFELLILSAIFVSGLFSTISTKNAGLVFLGIFIVFIYLAGQVFIPIAWCCIKSLLKL